MCLAFPGKIIKIEGRKVTVQYPSEARQVLVGDDPIKVGDFVLVQMGVVIKIITTEEAKIITEAWSEK